MKTQLVILLIGVGCLFPLFVFRIKSVLHIGNFLIIVVVSFILSQFILTHFFDDLNYRRGSSFLHVLRGLKLSDNKAPSLLLLGSSYTARNIDGKALEKKLLALGEEFNVHQMSYPGSFAYEQDFFLDQYLTEFPTPEIVVIEIGTEHSLLVKPENFLKHQTIAYHDSVRVRILLNSIFQKSSKYIIDNVSSVFVHALAHDVNLGLFHSFEPRYAGPVKNGYLPEKPTEQSPDQDQVKQGLFSLIKSTQADDYRVKFRKQQAQKLLNNGVNKVVFWQPPSADIEQRARTMSLCASLMPHCIKFDDPELLNGAFWTDMNHLNEKGAGILTNWLANRLVN